MTVNGNIVTVGKWQFEIDRSVPKIVSSLGKGDEIITEQKANLTAGNMTDGQVMLKIEVALPNDTIQGIEIYDETNSKIETINVPVGIKQIQKAQEIYVEFMEEKTYYAKIQGKVTEEDILAFEKGVILDDGYETMPSQLKILKSDDISEIELTIHEGKFHQVKRMFESVDKKVVYLKRISMGKLKLDESLELGEYRELTEEEVKLIEER